MTAKCVRSSTSNAGGIVMVQGSTHQNLYIIYALSESIDRNTGANLNLHEVAETKLQDMKSNMATLGKEDALAMAAVAAQQQQMTLQRLISMIELITKRLFRFLIILQESSPPPSFYEEVNNVPTDPIQNGTDDGVDYVLGEAIFSYFAESDVELNISTGVQLLNFVSNNGRAEGKCKRKADCSFSAKDEPSVVKSAVDGATVLKKTEDLLKSIEEHEDDEKRQTETKGTIQTPKELQPISSPINCSLGETKEATVAAAYNVAALSGIAPRHK
ncbi:SH3 domain-containing protein 2 [Artemisia annua]|uniref:SH3 domain-containing protein 2 n=1 Tax=Artemisia annua TaxID=35608 RepID=A0A2U1LF42_ARTAN|nr:SH3 domain-containing protein 2 [Artemisia annua]